MQLKQQKLKTSKTNSRTRKISLKNKKISRNKFIKTKKNKKNNNKLNIKIGGTKTNSNLPEYFPPPSFNNDNNGNAGNEFGFGNNGNAIDEFGFGNNNTIFGFPSNATGNVTGNAATGKNVAIPKPSVVYKDIHNNTKLGFGNAGGEFGSGFTRGEFGFGNNFAPEPEPLVKPEPLYYEKINIFDNIKTLNIFNQYDNFTTNRNNNAIHSLFTSIFKNENIKKKINDNKQSGKIIFEFFAQLLVYLERKGKLTKSDTNIILKNYRIPFIKEVIPDYIEPLLI